MCHAIKASNTSDFSECFPKKAVDPKNPPFFQPLTAPKKNPEVASDVGSESECADPEGTLFAAQQVAGAPVTEEERWVLSLPLVGDVKLESQSPFGGLVFFLVAGLVAQMLG